MRTGLPVRKRRVCERPIKLNNEKRVVAIRGVVVGSCGETIEEIMAAASALPGGAEGGDSWYQRLLSKMGQERQDPSKEEFAQALEERIDRVQKRVIPEGGDCWRVDASGEGATQFKLVGGAITRELDLLPVIRDDTQENWVLDELDLAIWRSIDPAGSELPVGGAPFRGFLQECTTSVPPRVTQMGARLIIAAAILTTLVILVVGVVTLILFPAWMGPIALFLVMGAAAPMLLLVTLSAANAAHAGLRELLVYQKQSKEWNASLEQLEVVLSDEADASVDAKRKRLLLAFTREMIGQLELFIGGKEREKRDLRAISPLWRKRVEWLSLLVEKSVGREPSGDIPLRTLLDLSTRLQLCEKWLLRSLGVVDGADQEGVSAGGSESLQEGGQKSVEARSG